MFYRSLFLILLPGMLMAQKSSTTVPTTPTIPPKQQAKPPARQGTSPIKQSIQNDMIKQNKAWEHSQQTRRMRPEEHFFPHPGILFEKNGTWYGDDFLYNLPKNIDIFIEVEKSNDVTIHIDESHPKQIIAGVFKKSGIVPQAEGGNPPFPYFHILIMVTAVDKAYAVYCSGRLFEHLNIERTNLDKDVYFQAITWEKQALLIIPAEKFKDELDKAIEDIANSFADRYRHFEEIELRKEKSDR
jgi:hypothetical protein